MMPEIDFSKYKTVTNDSLFKVKGKVVNVIGLTIESAGPVAKLGDICMISPGTGNANLLSQRWLALRKESFF